MHNLFFLTCCTVSLGALAQTNPFLPPNRPMLITTLRTGDTEVFTVNPITGDARNLSRSPKSEDRYAAWSPDGRQVVFTSNRANKDYFNVYVMNADGSHVRQITREKGVCYYPNFAANGRMIVYSYADDKAGVAQLIRITPSGTKRQVICDGRDGHVSTDGQKVVFTKKATKGFPLYTVAIDGKNLKQITPDHPNDLGAVGPVWSPNGKRILYVDQVSGKLEIFVCNADGKQIQQLTRLKQMSTSPAWSPDGRWISFRVTDNAFWHDETLKQKAYRDKQADKRPVYALRLAGGAAPQLLEPLHYQCAIDGSRGNWQP